MYKIIFRKGDFIVDGSSISVSSAAPKATDVPPISHFSNYNDRPLPDYSRVQPPTNRFNEHAFSRPYGMSKLFLL